MIVFKYIIGYIFEAIIYGIYYIGKVMTTVG